MKAEVVYERNEAFDMHSGPYGYERVGFSIGGRVFWTGCAGSGLPGSTWEADKALAEQVVARWNAAQPSDTPEAARREGALRELRRGAGMGERETFLRRVAESVLDANGERWVYRRVAAVLERRRWSSSVWNDVQAADFLRMTPTELRHIADVLERREEPPDAD